MAVKFLDYTGLGYFWSKIKAWCNATFAAITHNHASNAVNVMTGYSKPNSGSAIATSDSLNSAIGKLEAKVDAIDQSNVVHITGAESITGTKSFKDSLNLYNSSLTKGTIPNLTQYYSISLTDNSLSNRFGLFETAVNNQGDVTTYIGSYKNEANSPTTLLGVACLADGTKYGFAPDTPTTRNNTDDIVTRGFIPNDTRIVHTTNVDETIYGYKTFCGDITIKRVNPYLRFVETDITRLTDNTATSYSGIYFKDKDENNICNIISHTNSSGNWLTLTAFDSTENNPAILTVVCSTDGSNRYIAGPTPISNANSTQLITASWANSKYVNLTSAQTIEGVKTFVNTPHVENGTPRIWFVDTDYTRNTNNHPYGGLYFNDKNGSTFGSILFHDYSNTNKTPAISFYLGDPTRTDDTNEMSLHWRYWGSPTNTALMPGLNDTCYLGVNSYRWKNIYTASSSINYSDKRLKDEIINVSDDLLNAWENLNWVQYKFKKAIKEKGNNARIHVGLIAQDIDLVLKNYDVSADKFGFFCYDSWDEPVDSSDNSKTSQRNIGDVYSLRYEEVLCIEAAYQRRKNKILENRISELERQVSDMLQILQSLKRS